MTKLRGEAYRKWLADKVKRKAEIIALHKSGISQAEIARRLGVRRQRVYQIIRGD